MVAQLYNIFICMYILEAKYSMYMYSSWNFEVFFYWWGRILSYYYCQ